MKIEMTDTWKDYTDRANNFADWFTAIIISNFAYLIHLVNQDHRILASILESKLYLWNWGFKISCGALICVFIAKLLSVLAASKRFHKGPKNKCQEWMEKVRFVFIIFFFFLGMVSLVFSGIILRYNKIMLVRNHI